jgi:hypothetical protein
MRCHGRAWIVVKRCAAPGSGFFVADLHWRLMPQRHDIKRKDIDYGDTPSGGEQDASETYNQRNEAGADDEKAGEGDERFVCFADGTTDG